MEALLPSLGYKIISFRVAIFLFQTSLKSTIFKVRVHCGTVEDDLYVIITQVTYQLKPCFFRLVANGTNRYVYVSIGVDCGSLKTKIRYFLTNQNSIWKKSDYALRGASLNSHISVVVFYTHFQCPSLIYIELLKRSCVYFELKYLVPDFVLVGNFLTKICWRTVDRLWQKISLHFVPRDNTHVKWKELNRGIHSFNSYKQMCSSVEHRQYSPAAGFSPATCFCVTLMRQSKQPCLDLK